MGHKHKKRGTCQRLVFIAYFARNFGDDDSEFNVVL